MSISANTCLEATLRGAILSLLVLCQLASAEEIRKWVDADGRIHYGDKNSVVDAVTVEDIQVEETFDQQAYEEARQRDRELQQDLDKIEVQRKEEARRQQELEALKQSQPARRPSTIINLPQPYYEIPPNAPGYPGIGGRPRPTPLPAQHR